LLAGLLVSSPQPTDEAPSVVNRKLRKFLR
jgi:hypothetical protein